AEAAAKSDDAEQPDRAREAVGKPPHRNLLHPGSGNREALPDEEQPEIAMPERAKRLAESHGRLAPRRPRPRQLESRASCVFSCSRIAANAVSRPRSWSTTWAGARATKLSLPSFAIAFAISPSRRATSFAMRSRSATGS